MAKMMAWAILLASHTSWVSNEMRYFKGPQSYLNNVSRSFQGQPRCHSVESWALGIASEKGDIETTCGNVACHSVTSMLDGLLPYALPKSQQGLFAGYL